MMEIKEYLNYRKDLFEDSKDEDGFIQQSLLLSEVLPIMLDAKIVDSEDYNDSYFVYEAEKIKINAYVVNESGERLQLFIIDENSINETTPDEEICISTRDYYERHFKRAKKFVKRNFIEKI